MEIKTQAVIYCGECAYCKEIAPFDFLMARPYCLRNETQPRRVQTTDHCSKAKWKGRTEHENDR